MNSEAFIAQSMCKEVLSKSSSGGMFAELAKYIISKQGVVFGCAMKRVQQGFDVKHIYIIKHTNIYFLVCFKFITFNM